MTDVEAARLVMRAATEHWAQNTRDTALREALNHMERNLVEYEKIQSYLNSFGGGDLRH